MRVELWKLPGEPVSPTRCWKVDCLGPRKTCAFHWGISFALRQDLEFDDVTDLRFRPGHRRATVSVWFEVSKAARHTLREARFECGTAGDRPRRAPRDGRPSDAVRDRARQCSCAAPRLPDQPSRHYAVALVRNAQPVAVRPHCFNLFRRFDQGLHTRRGIAGVGAWTVTATTAPVSRSTACSALWARCVRPSFIFVTLHRDRYDASTRIRAVLRPLPIDSREILYLLDYFYF